MRLATLMRALWAGLCLWVLFLWAAPAAAEGSVLRGPYLLGVSSTSVRVVWESPAPSTGIVTFGVASVDEDDRGAVEPRTHQSVTLEPLLPSTDYRFSVRIDGATTLDGTFRTAPPPGSTAPFSFIVYGDNRSNETQHAAVVAAIRSEPTPIDFLMNTGDLVDDGLREDQWDTFFGVEQALLAEKPLFMAVGNHEVEGGDVSVTKRIFELDDAFYDVVVGNTQLIVVNIEVDDLDDQGSGAQVLWLREVLAAPPAGVTHRFAFIHQGPYSSKPGRTGNYWMRRWLDQLDAAGIDVLFSGHDHYAERGFTARGFPYVVHGGGGAPLYDHLGLRVTADHTIVYGEPSLGYALVEVDGDRASVTLRSLEGGTVSSFSYGDAQTPECMIAEDCGAAPPYGCVGGAWECRQFACERICPDDGSLSIECVTNDECALVFGATCLGDPLCVPSGGQTYCACIDVPECDGPADCQGRAPPIAGCPGGWLCDRDTCEFLPLAGICDSPADAGEPVRPEPVAREAPRTQAPPAASAPSRPTCDCAAAGGLRSRAAGALVALLALPLVVPLGGPRRRAVALRRS